MRVRILTALVLIPFVLGAVFTASPWPVLALAFAAAGLASFELADLFEMGPSAMPITGLSLTSAYGIAAATLSPEVFVRYLPQSTLVLALLFAASLVAARALMRGKRSRLLLEVASLWIGAPLTFLVYIHGAHPGSVTEIIRFDSPVLMIVPTLWAGDTSAILAGKFFGRIPLAPTISPKKSWEGAVANLVFCTLTAWGIGALLGYPTVESLAVGVTIGITGQLGDLFESALKRSVGKKDSGAILPGHGGILDRVDSLLFAAIPAGAILVGWIGHR